MKKIFIAYANENMAYSLKRIGKQAHKLNIFDEVILWTPNELPEYIKQSPLMKYSYGGGFWAWKPCIIYETLQRYEDGTIVCYVDAGCTLNKGVEWEMFFEIMEDYDSLCFHYQKIVPEWQKYGTISTKIKHWGKRSLLEFLDEYLGDDAYREYNKVLGGILFFKNQNNAFVKDWLDIIMHHPEVVFEPTGEECNNQYPYFALHKHEQPVITALSVKHKEKCLVLPELFEFKTGGAIQASRIRAKDVKEYSVIMLKRYVRMFLGNRLADVLKRICK